MFYRCPSSERTWTLWTAKGQVGFLDEGRGRGQWRQRSSFHKELLLLKWSIQNKFPQHTCMGQSMKSLSIHFWVFISYQEYEESLLWNTLQKNLSKLMPFKRVQMHKHMKRCSPPLIRRKCNSKPGDVTSHPLGWLCIKIRKSQVWMRMERLEPLCGVSVDATVPPPGNRVWGFLKNQKQNYPMRKKSHPGYLSKKWKQLQSERSPTPVFTAASFTVAKRCKPKVQEWMGGKQNVVHPYNGTPFSLLNRKEFCHRLPPVKPEGYSK